MTASFHEDLRRADKIKRGTDRSFGLTVGGIILLIALGRAWLKGLGWLEVGLGEIGVVLIVLGLIAPRSLRGLHGAWLKLGLIMARVMNPIVLGLIYGTTILPIGLLMRLTGRDLLGLARDANARSYWVVRDPPGPPPPSMTRQF